MPAVTVRRLSEETMRALKARAAAHGRSTEGEIRAILQDAVKPAQRLEVGSALAAFGRKHGGLTLTVERDRTPLRSAEFD